MEYTLTEMEKDMKWLVKHGIRTDEAYDFIQKLLKVD